MKKSILLSISCFAVGFLASQYSQDRTELEIYTSDNIYYLNGLTVTNEADEETLNFNSKEGLKTFISDITANDVLSARIGYLINEGYGLDASTHIAKVELKLIPEDEAYTALMED